jgi:hypothetical protein
LLLVTKRAMPVGGTSLREAKLGRLRRQGPLRNGNGNSIVASVAAHRNSDYYQRSGVSN